VGASGVARECGQGVVCPEHIALLWKATAHGRWEGEWQARSGLAMTDLYDATGTDRKAVGGYRGHGVTRERKHDTRNGGAS
jgi:hypothetical protein